MGDKISIHGDGWCFGMEFFIQAALFEISDYADWGIVRLEDGPRHNRTDGEVDGLYFACRATNLTLSENNPWRVTEARLFGPFRVNANGYSYQTVWSAALKALQKTKEKKVDVNCSKEKLEEVARELLGYEIERPQQSGG